MTSPLPAHRTHLSHHPAHRPTLLALALLLSTGGAACATRAPLMTRRLPAVEAEAPLVVHQPIAPGTSEVVFGRLVQRLQERGYRVAACDEAVGALTTTTTEVDADCRTTTCLARDQVMVKTGWRNVSVTIHRQVFDGGLRAWVDTAEQGARTGVLKDARALVASLQLLELTAPPKGLPAPRRAACPGLSACAPGQCLSRR